MSPANAQDAGPVIVCCASSEASAIAEALEELTTVGHTVEIVATVVDDPHVLGPVIERFHGDGLYVLCRSADLGRDTVEQLREILLAQHVPFGRTVTVATTRPRDLLERVRSSLARASTRKTRDPGAPLPRTTMSINEPARPRTRTPPPRRRTEDDDTTTGVQPKPPPRRRHATIQNLAPPPTPKPRRYEQTHDVDFDPPTEPLPPEKARRLLGKMAQQTPASLPPPPPDSAAVSMTEHIVDLETHDPEISMMNASLDQLDFSDLDAPSETRTLPPDVNASPVGPIRTGNTKVTPMPKPDRKPLVPGLPPITSATPSTTATMPPPSASETPSSTATLPPPSASAPLPAAPSPPPPPELRPTMAATTAPPVPPAPPSTPPPPAPASVAPAASPSAAGSFPAASASSPAGAAASTMEDEPSVSRTILWAGGLAALVLLSITLAFLLGDDDEDASDDKEVATKSESKQGASGKTSDGPKTTTPATEDTADGGDGPDAGDDGSAASSGTPDATIVALADRKVRALDILLVQPASAGPMSHTDAATYCADLEIAGLQGWRLPEVGELYSLTEAGMVGRSTYWSRTRGDTFGDRHLVWNGRKWRAEHSSAESRVLCVRDTQDG